MNIDILIEMLEVINVRIIRSYKKLGIKEIPQIPLPIGHRIGDRSGRTVIGTVSAEEIDTGTLKVKHLKSKKE